MLSFPLRSVVWAIPPRPLYLCFHNFIITLYFPSLHPNKRPAINPAAIASPTHIYFKIRKLFNILVSFFKELLYTFIFISCFLCFFLRRILLQFTSVCLWLVLFNYKLSDVIGGYVMLVCRGVNHEAGLGLRWKHFRKNFVKRFSRQSEFSNLYRYHLLEWGKGEINILRKYKTNVFISTPGRLG